MTIDQPRGVFAADHTTPSDAANAARWSGMTQFGVPFGVPGRHGSLGCRRYMMSTPPCSTLTLLPGSRRIPWKPSLISGLRLFQTPTGQTQRPGSGSGCLLAPELDPAPLEDVGRVCVDDAPLSSRSDEAPDFRPRCQK